MFSQNLQKVKSKLKQSVSFLMLAILIANITGALFLWHIATEGTDDHDCNDCIICQITFINSAKIVNTSPTTVFYINVVAHAISYKSDQPLTIQNTSYIIPRAPPA